MFPFRYGFIENFVCDTITSILIGVVVITHVPLKDNEELGFISSL